MGKIGLATRDYHHTKFTVTINSSRFTTVKQDPNLSKSFGKSAEHNGNNSNYIPKNEKLGETNQRRSSRTFF